MLFSDNRHHSKPRTDNELNGRYEAKLGLEKRNSRCGTVMCVRFKFTLRT